MASTRKLSRASRRRWAVTGLLGLLIVTPGGPARGQGSRAALTLEPSDAVGLDELAVLRIKIEGAGTRINPDPRFQLENFRVAAGPFQSSSITIYNGVPSSNVTLSWHLKPLAVGKARVYSASVNIGGADFDLGERQVEVLREAPPGRRRPADPFDSVSRNDPFSSRSALEELLGRRRQRPRPRTAPRVFLRTQAEPANPYVGQQVLYTLYLFTEVDVRSIDPQDLPDFKGFWSRVIPQPDRIEPELVSWEGESIYRFVLLQRALFPRRAGAFEVPPVSATMEALVRDTSPFGSLLPRSRDITRQSNTVTVEVRALPTAPDGFHGAVGEISLQAGLKPRELEVGAAATLTLTLDGRGHLQGVPAPQLPELAGIKVFPPQQQGDETLKGTRVTSRRTWSYVLVPEHPGEWRLPPIEMPYFDPRRQSFATAATAELELTARGSTSLAQDSGHTVELHPIRSAALPVVEGGQGRWTSAGPWLFGLPWGLAGLLLLIRRRSTSGGGFVHARKEILRRLRSAADEEKPRQAAAQMKEAWRDFLEERWGVPQGTASTQWSSLLVEAGAQPQAAGELVELADDLHYLRYAPKLSSTVEMRKEMIERSRRLLKVLR